MPPVAPGTRVWFEFGCGLVGGFVVVGVQGRQGVLGWTKVNFDDGETLTVKLDPLAQGDAWDTTDLSTMGSVSM